MIPIIDIFAGPGGLNEGFSAVRDASGNRVFQTVLSIEMERSAVRTLRLRAAHRELVDLPGGPPQAYIDFLSGIIGLEELRANKHAEKALEHAELEVQQFELHESSRPESDRLIRDALPEGTEEWVLIGGPPCQAYSLAGRSRRTKDELFEQDHKHFLYKEYLHVIAEFKPTVFVMENVKGILSSTNSGDRIFDLIQKDLRNPTGSLEYELHSMVLNQEDSALTPEKFIIRAERYGIPQKRHRVIIVGFRKDAQLPTPKALTEVKELTVLDAISNMPKIRSSMSRNKNAAWDEWSAVRTTSAKRLHDITNYGAEGYSNEYRLETSSASSPSLPDVAETNSELHSWLREGPCPAIWNHEARGHMEADLVRYYLLASIANHSGVSPKVRDLPKEYWPQHKNINNENVPFEDRFRVQLWGRAATTIVSHIAKDGHYYIHPDPQQMRSLSVREAARIQTFPDNYIFLGNRTEQFTQVGNAVPPLLAVQIADRVNEALQNR